MRLAKTLIGGGGVVKQNPRAYLLTEKDIVVLPKFADGKTFAETTIFVGLGYEPRGVHERLSCYHEH